MATEPCRPRVCWLYGTELIWCHGNICSRVEKEGPSLDLSRCWSPHWMCFVDLLLGTPGSFLVLPSALPKSQAGARCWLVHLYAGLVHHPAAHLVAMQVEVLLLCCSWFYSLVHGFFEQKAALPGLDEMDCN